MTTVALTDERPRSGEHTRPRVHRAEDPDAASVRAARRWLSGELAKTGVNDEQGADAVLVLSELFSNAVLYAAGPITLTATIRPHVVHLTVADRIPDVPRPSTLPDDAHGRGLLIVHALCKDVYETTDPAAGRHAVTAAISLETDRLP